MLIAMNEENNLIQAHKKLNRRKRYYCPACKERVYLKVGQVIASHFAHFKESDCQAFSEGETAEHLKGKQILAETIERMDKQRDKKFKVEIEAYLPNLKQRPDIFIQNSKKKIAIEFQCSSLSIEKVIKRTEGYQNNGYQVIWILGTNFKYQNILTSFQKACMYFDRQSHDFYLFHLDVKKNMLIIQSQFCLCQNQKLKCQTTLIDLERIKIINKNKNKRPKIQEINEFIFDQKHKELMKNQYFSTKESRCFYQLLYVKKESIQTIPLELYLTVPSEWLLQTYSFEWKYRFILWLETLPKNRIITGKFLLRWLQKEIKAGNITYHLFAQLSVDYRLKPFYEYLNFLGEKGIVKSVGTNQWKMIRKLNRYKNLEEKYIFFKSKTL